MSLYPWELNDLWRERIRDAKRLRRGADNRDDSREMDIPLGLGGPAFGHDPSSVGDVLKDRSDKGTAPEGCPTYS